MSINTFSSGINTSFSTELNENFKGISINSKAAIQASLGNNYEEIKQWDVENVGTFTDIFADESNKDTTTNVIYADLGSEGIYYLDDGSTGDYRSDTVINYIKNVETLVVSVNAQVLNLLDNFDDASISGD